MHRTDIAALICARIASEADAARSRYCDSETAIGHFVIDDLLPAQIASEIARTFPPKEAMTGKRSLRERKAVTARMAECNPLIGEAIYAFQDKAVLDVVADITGIAAIEADPFLYAGGISAMGPGDFLNPHLDNSHDKDRARWRALNLLYYVAPCEGGELELWPESGERIAIAPRFNRLAVMATHGKAWHSVALIRSGTRLCVSNYYFTPEPLRQADRFHVTSFRGRPEQRLADVVLRADAALRSTVRRLVPGGIGRSRHINTA